MHCVDYWDERPPSQDKVYIPESEMWREAINK
jgi:hypothetical protein